MRSKSTQTNESFLVQLFISSDFSPLSLEEKWSSAFLALKNPRKEQREPLLFVTMKIYTLVVVSSISSHSKESSQEAACSNLFMN